MRNTKKSKRPAPGIRRVGQDEYVVRVAMRDPVTGKHREKERRLQGVTMTQALTVREQLREELQELIDKGDGRRISATPRQGTYETLSAYAKRWLAHVERTGRKRPHVVARDVNKLDVHILPFLGHLPLDQIGKRELATWMEALSSQKRRDGKSYSKESLRSAWRLVVTMLRDAQVLADLEQDPTQGMRFHSKAEKTGTKHTLTRNELTALLIAADHETPDIRAMMWVIATTGMRFGEVSALEWEDIDFERGLVHVRRSQVEGKVFPTKTSTNRSVPLHPTVASILKEHRVWLERRRNPRGLVFPSTQGTYRSPSIMTKPMQRCAERAGIEKTVSNQALRRTVNNLIRQTAGEIAARAITGHATQAMTEHYSDVTVDEKHLAQQRALGGLVGVPVGVRPEFDENPNETIPVTPGKVMARPEGLEPSTPGLEVRSDSFPGFPSRPSRPLARRCRGGLCFC